MPPALNTWDSLPPLSWPCHIVWLWSFQPWMGLPCRNTAFGICCPGRMNCGSGTDQNHLPCQPRLLAASCAWSRLGPAVNPMSLSHRSVGNHLKCVRTLAETSHLFSSISSPLHQQCCHNLSKSTGHYSLM